MVMSENIIDVLASIDAETIAATYGKNNTDPNHPRQVDQKYIHMVVKDASALKGQGGGELEIQAFTLDEIRWRSTSLTLEGSYDVLFYGFVATEGAKLISKPEPRLVTVKSLLPDPDNPLKPTIQTTQNYFWECTVEQQGEVTYHLQFMIYERSSGNLNLVGYYWWDPFIKITD